MNENEPITFLEYAKSVYDASTEQIKGDETYAQSVEEAVLYAIQNVSAHLPELILFGVKIEGSEISLEWIKVSKNEWHDKLDEAEAAAQRRFFETLSSGLGG